MLSRNAQKHQRCLSAHGLPRKRHDITLQEFQLELEEVQMALDQAQRQNRNSVVQLVGFGNHNGAMTAGISLGNLDTASNVGVFVSGMYSGVDGLPNALPGLSAIQNTDPEKAMVTWIGYNSPDIFSVGGQKRADAGAQQLAPFLESIDHANRKLDRFTVIGHSYGTNVVAEALKITTADVDVKVTLASAGVVSGTTMENLGVDEFYATEAAADELALVGQAISGRVDPQGLDGVVGFSSEATSYGEAGTSHSVTEKGPDEVGYMDITSSAWYALNAIIDGPLDEDDIVLKEGLWVEFPKDLEGSAR